MNATKERQAWCCLQVKLCDPCLSALCVPWCKKALYKYSSFPFFSFIKYGCKKTSCRSNCSCRSQHLNCSEMCGCGANGEVCSKVNQTLLGIDEDGEDGWRSFHLTMNTNSSRTFNPLKLTRNSQNGSKKCLVY